MGTRGIPNNYGGFEQFSEYLALGLQQRGFEVSVYNSHDHPYKETEWKGIKILHHFDPEYLIGTAGQFIYDLNCILHSRRKKFDIILQLGYTSSSVWNFLFPKRSVIVTNMDGLEWKRTKYSAKTQRFLKYAEKLAVKRSDHLVSDSIGIKKYLLETYDADSTYIPYGADVFSNPDPAILSKFGLSANRYDMLVARLEPENSIEMILDGFESSGADRSFIVIANHKTKYGTFLREKYRNSGRIKFLGPVYDIMQLNNLRYHSNLYFHGHTVGGTNPSLLEAMASCALIAANKNDFNAAILGDDAFYFSDSNEVLKLINSVTKDEMLQMKVRANVSKIKDLYSWKAITDSYEKLFLEVTDTDKKKTS